MHDTCNKNCEGFCINLVVISPYLYLQNSLVVISLEQFEARKSLTPSL